MQLNHLPYRYRLATLLALAFGVALAAITTNTVQAQATQSPITPASQAAITETVESVTPADLGPGDRQWHTANDRDGGFSAITANQPDPAGGRGALEQILPEPGSVTAKTDFQISDQTSGFGLLRDLDALGFAWWRSSDSSAPANLTPAFRLTVFDPATNSSYRLIWEGAYNGYPTSGAPVPVDQWVNEEILAGNFWRVPQFVDGVFQGIEVCNADPALCFVYDRGLDEWGLGPETQVVGLEVGLGSGWNGSYRAFVDQIQIGFDGAATRYDFEPGPPPDMQGPSIENLHLVPSLVGVTATLTATVDDSRSGNSTITAAEYSLDAAATWHPLAATDGAFDNVTEVVSTTIAGTEIAPSGLEICVRGTDSADNLGAATCATIKIADPDAGFVTAGGWITDSLSITPTQPVMPTQPISPTPPVSGTHPMTEPVGTNLKATFGLTAKYLPNDETPQGNVQFNAHASGLKFHSTRLETLVINPTQGTAEITGLGRVQGQPPLEAIPLRFQIWLVDGAPDQFAIRIWGADGAQTVFYETPGLAILGGGSVGIHGQPATSDDSEDDIEGDGTGEDSPEGPQENARESIDRESIDRERLDGDRNEQGSGSSTDDLLPTPHGLYLPLIPAGDA